MKKFYFTLCLLVCIMSMASSYNWANCVILDFGAGHRGDGQFSGHVAELELPVPCKVASVWANSFLMVDAVPPRIVSVSSPTADGNYKVGDIIKIELNFSEPVWVDRWPELTLETGTIDRVIYYSTGSGTNKFTFNYTVQAGDLSARLDYKSTTALVLNSSTIRDLAGNDAVTTLPVPGQANSLSAGKNIVVDGVAPTVVSVSSPAVDRTYKVGEEMDIQVEFSENVMVTGVPVLTLETGATDRPINYSSGSSTSTLTFKYKVQVGDASADLNYLAANALSANGGAIRDIAGNLAILNLPALGTSTSLAGNKAIVIDGTPSTVLSVTSGSTNGTYRIGQSITVLVNFSENVTVSGTPQLSLETGVTDRVINYTSGSGSSTLRFDYIVQLGDYTSDLDYVAINALKLNGGTLKDARGNDFILTLPLPGAALSLSASSNIAIEQVRPNTNGILFVNRQASGAAENGTAWSTAVRELSNALKLAKTNTSIKEIWVSFGTHVPMYSPADDNFGIDAGRANAFLMVRDVKIFGGFEGIETATSQRDTVNWTHQTILSGDIGIVGNKDDNVHHVVIASGDVGSAQLNGFTITGGNADPTGGGQIIVNSNVIYPAHGGGMYHVFSSPQLRHLTISGNNTSMGHGAGIYNISASPVIRNVTLSGNAAGSGGNGGGIYNSNSSPELTDVAINGNSAVQGGQGGGVYNISSSPTLTNVNISGNSTTAYGGGMCSQSSSPVLTNVTISENFSTNSDGGGIYFSSSSQPILTNVTITKNRAVTGGGMYVRVASLTFKGGVISGNSASSMGGGLYNDGPSALTNITISGNTATHVGGGIYNTSPSVLTNVSITGNRVNIYGGGIYNTSSPIFTNVTMAGNLAGDGGGGIYSSSAAEAPKFYNTVIHGNSSGVRNEAGAKPEFYHSIVQGSGGSSAWVASAGFDGGHNLDIDPQFVAAPDHATAPFAAGDYQLQSSSPAINAGDKNAFAGLSPTTTDLAGNPRVYGYADQGELDLGAYEYQAAIVTPDANGRVFVQKGRSGNGSSWSSPLGEVAQALQGAAGNTAITQIWVAAGTYQPAAGTSFSLVEGVEMYGGFAGGETLVAARDWKNNLTILQGNGSRVINNNFTAARPMTSATLLDGFNISGGVASMGGGIYNNYASPTISNVIISGNRAVNPGGGGMYNANSSSPWLSNVAITGNTANNGGGIYNLTNASPVLINVTIAGNSATSFGGAIFNAATASYDIHNSLVWGNTGGSFHGIHDRSSLTSSISYSLVQEMNATDNGNLSATGVTAAQLFNGPAVAGLNTAGDYTLKSGSVAIAAGRNSLFSGLTATARDLAGNARVYNFATSGTIDLGAYEYQGLLSQTISFAALEGKTTTSGDFILGANASSGLAVSYSSSNTAIAEVYQENAVWKVKSKAAGSVVITAGQGGNGDYAAASAVDQTLVIVDATLPVQLTNFTAKVVNQTARLDWSVATERDNRKFVIYRSGDDGQFAEIGTVLGLGNTNANSNYFFVDKLPLSGNNYYKLVQVDLDGRTTELGVKPLNFVLSVVNVSVYPNPAKGEVKVSFEPGKYKRIILSGVDGKVLQSFGPGAQHDLLRIDLSAYPVGVYFIRLSGAKDGLVKKVVKQ